MVFIFEYLLNSFGLGFDVCRVLPGVEYRVFSVLDPYGGVDWLFDNLFKTCEEEVLGRV